MLLVVFGKSGTQWLVRASSVAAAERRWQVAVDAGTAEPATHIRPLSGDRATARWLRANGQADDNA